jgi:ABC-type phosphate transport system ATPase subunit
MREMTKFGSGESSGADQQQDGTAAITRDARLIRVVDYDFFYGESKVLHAINMEIAEKEVTALIGPSGCGKSTLLRNFNRMNVLVDDVHHAGADVLFLRFILSQNDQRP